MQESENKNLIYYSTPISEKLKFMNKSIFQLVL